MINLGVHAQSTLPEVQYYYVEEKSPDLLQPTSQNRLLKHIFSNAIIKLTHVTNGTFFNYILDNSKDSVDIDLTNLSSGQYIVNLISGGQVLDTKNLIKN